jgi:hypothetical protein
LVTSSEPSRFPPPPSFGDAQPAPQPPREIVFAFWGFLVAAILNLVGGLLVLGTRQEIVNRIRTGQKPGTTLSDADINNAASLLIVGLIIVAVVVAGLYVLFSFKLRAGRNWARILITIVALFALISLVQDRGGSWVSYVAEAAAVIAAVLSYFPNSNEYIAEIKASRRPR